MATTVKTIFNKTLFYKLLFIRDKIFNLKNYNRVSDITILEIRDNYIKAKYKARYGGIYYDTNIFTVGKYKITASGYNCKILLNNRSVSPSKAVFDLDFTNTQTLVRKSVTFTITEDMKELQFLIHFFNATIQKPIEGCIKNIRIEKLKN